MTRSRTRWNIGNKVNDLEIKDARNEGSIIGQNVLVAYQELGKTKLSENGSSLVNILDDFLNDENLVTVSTLPSPIITTGLTPWLWNERDSAKETTCRASHDLTKEEWQKMGNLAEDQSNNIKPANKGLRVVI